MLQVHRNSLFLSQLSCGLSLIHASDLLKAGDEWCFSKIKYNNSQIPKTCIFIFLREEFQGHFWGNMDAWSCWWEQILQMWLDGRWYLSISCLPSSIHIAPPLSKMYHLPSINRCNIWSHKHDQTSSLPRKCLWAVDGSRFCSCD